ncbi:MAG: hypothetical protein ACJ74J_10895 [Blastocatellia bacterium]
MARGTLASICGGWDAVVKAANVTFGGGFILLSEGAWATDPPRFESAALLSDSARCQRGRAFDSKRELRWREADSGRFILTYLSEDGAPPPEAGLVLSGEEWQTNPTIQKLYGTWSQTAKDWVEVAVPGISQAYKGIASIALQVNALQIAAIDYSKNGMVQMTRFCAIEPYRI